MQTRSLLVALGLAPVLILSALASAQRLRAQLPSGASREGVQRAQAQAQVRLLEVQKRHLEEQGKEQADDLKELEREQIEQLKGEANRQVEQVMRQAKRQIEQVRRQVKRQLELLDAQIQLVEAQAGIRSEASKSVRQTEQPIGRSSSPEARNVKRPPAVSSSVEEKLDKILDRLERVEKRLDKLEKAQ